MKKISDNEVTFTSGLIDLIENPLPQIKKESALAKTTTPSKLVGRKVQLLAGLVGDMPKATGISTAPTAEDKLAVREQQVYLEATRIAQQAEYKKLTGSAPRKLRYIIQQLKASEALSEEDKATLLPPDVSAIMPRLFNINEIPDLSVWHGDHCEFLVDWIDDPSASFNIKAEPQPGGELFLEPSPGVENCWRFCYTPEKNDKFPFTVTVSAVSDKQSSLQSFEINPMPKLPPEQTIFGTTSHTQAGPVDFRRPEVTVEKVEHTVMQDANFNFNYLKPTREANITLRKVKILGDSVIFDQDHDEFGLYATYNNAVDIEQLELTAKEVIIRSPLRLHQTNVIINAKELRFEGEVAQIKTTPFEKDKKPGMSQPGEDGLTAGNITLNILRFSDDVKTGNIHRFELTGGHGQASGDGKDGADGASSTYVSNVMDFTEPGLSSFHKKPPEGYYVIYEVAYCLLLKGYSRGNEQFWPSDGSDAEPSGKPGEGGGGGLLVSSYDVSTHAIFDGGQAGAAAKHPEGHSCYRGGLAGTPNKSIKYKAIYFLTASFTELGRHESKPGKNAEIRHAEHAYGETGACRAGGNPYTWIDPILVNKMLNRIKDKYLANRLDDASSRLDEYVQIIGEYMASENWEILPGKQQIEIKQMVDEMEILRHRISSNLDYFGHSSGWVPSLSFEVIKNFFESEIKSATHILSYAYYIKNKGAATEKRFESLKSMRKRLDDDISIAVSRYNKAIDRIPELKITAENLHKQTLETQNKLEAKETELAQQADEQTRPPAWLFGARLGLKISATIINMIPVYQPALGAVGGGLNLLSDFDPNKPWDTIIGGVDLTTQVLSDINKEAEQEIKTKLDKNKVNNIIKNLKEPHVLDEKYNKSGGDDKFNKDYQDYKDQKKMFANMPLNMQRLEAARKSSSALSTGLNDIQGFLTTYHAPQSEIDAELEKLKSQSDEYQTLVDDIKALLKRKSDFMEKLTATLQEVSSLSNFITRSILAMDAISLDIEQVQQGLDPRVMEYIADMERRAYDRLLEYHYYMAKAYEYRMLKPYTKPLNFEHLIKRLEKQANVNSWKDLDPAMFISTYRAVFEDILSEIEEQIFIDYSEKAKEKSRKYSYLLSGEELEQLNAGKAVSVNFARYLPKEENLRIVDIGIQMLNEAKRKGDIETMAVGGKYPRNAYIDFTFIHPSISKIRSAGTIYQFQHQSVDWEDRYEPDSDMVNHTSLSDASKSLMKSQLNNKATTDINLYSRPAVWSNLQITKSGVPKGGRDIRINRLKLELSYDSSKSRNIVNKQILVTAIVPGDGGSVKVLETDFQPYFIVDTEDKNNRQDARGAFLRIYQHKPYDTVTITAQPKYGNYIFNQWTDVDGVELPNTKGTSISLELNRSQFICAQYLSPEVMTKQVLMIASAIPHATEIGTIKAEETELP